MPNIFTEIAKVGKILAQGFASVGSELSKIRQQLAEIRQEQKEQTASLSEVKQEQLAQSTTLKVVVKELEELRSMLSPPQPVAFRIDIKHNEGESQTP